MKSRQAWQSLLVSAVLWAGILAMIHFWPRHVSWRALATSAPTNATKMTYLPRASEELTKLVANQPAFGVLVSRMRVNLVDISVPPDNQGVGPLIELKNRAADELQGLDANPNLDDEAFQFPGSVDAVVDSFGTCHSHIPKNGVSTYCDATPLSEFVSRGSYTFTFPLHSVLKEDFCSPVDLGNADPACLRRSVTYRLTFSDGAMRIYSSGSTNQGGLAGGLFWLMENAVIAMSVDWRTQLSPVFYELNSCGFNPSCENTGMLSYKLNNMGAALVWPVDLGFTYSEVDPDHLSMAYVRSTPEFVNWGGDQFERCLEAHYDPLAWNQPAIPVIPSQTTPIETTGCTQLFPQYLLAHPDWFHEHPIWAIRFKVAGDKVPTGPITQADVDRYSEKPEWQILREKKSSP